MIRISVTPMIFAIQSVVFFSVEFLTYKVAAINAENAENACINPSIIPNSIGIIPNVASVKNPAETKTRKPWVICKYSCDRLKNDFLNVRNSNPTPKVAPANIMMY